MAHRRMPIRTETVEALVVWSRSLDGHLRKGGATSRTNFAIANIMIEAAKTDALLTQHRGGHRSTPRDALKPWEVTQERRIHDLTQAALRGEAVLSCRS